MANKGSNKIPTAEEEALQEPSIDPTFLAGTGISEGPMAALKLLGTLLGQTWLMNRAKIPKRLQHLFNETETPKASKASSGAVNRFIKSAETEANKDAGPGMRKYYNPSMRNYAADRTIKRMLDPLTMEQMSAESAPGLREKALYKLAQTLASKEDFNSIANRGWSEKMLELMKGAKSIPILMGE